MQGKEKNSANPGRSESGEEETNEPEIKYGKVALLKGPDYYNYEDYKIKWG